MEQFYFVITEKCNLTCTHCIRNSSPLRDETAEFAMIKNTIDQIAATYPYSLLLLSGGEPTIHKNFLDILAHALQTGMRVNLNTNGLTPFFKSVNLRMLKNSNLSVQVSVDGDEEAHDLVRGIGTFRNALKTINRLVEHGVTCCVSTTVVDCGFLERADNFISSLDNLGLAHIALKRATYAGRASTGVKINTPEWNQQVYRLRKRQWKTPLKMFPMYDFSRLDKLPNELLEKLMLPESAINCGAGTSKAYIYSNGDVCPCTCFRNIPMGNLYTTPLQLILKNKPDFKCNHPVCNACKYFAMCRGGCLGSGYQSSGVMGEPDPRCPKIAAMRTEHGINLFLRTS